MRIESLIVATDFSEAWLAGARWVAKYFAPNADMLLVHVVEPPERPGFAASLLPPPDAIEASLREAAETRIRDAFSSVLPATRYEVRVGKPYEQIAEAARACNADLIVVGPHGDRPARQSWLGVTAERIVRASSVPVLVAINPPPTRPRRLLVPIDGNRLSESILAWAGHLAEFFDAEVKLLHVWSDTIYGYVASMARLTSADDDKARRELDKEVHDAALHWLADHTVTGFSGRRAAAIVSHGQAGDVTLEIAAASHADLVVMGRSGRGLSPALFGSTLRTVLHHAKCPVFVVTEPAAGL